MPKGILGNGFFSDSKNDRHSMRIAVPILSLQAYETDWNAPVKMNLRIGRFGSSAYLFRFLRKPPIFDADFDCRPVLPVR